MMKIEKTAPDEGYIIITEEDFREQLAEGLSRDEILFPGRHKFIRGGFRKRYPDFDPAKATVRYNVTLSLPPEIYAYFEQKAKELNLSSCAQVLESLLIEIAQKEQKTNSEPAVPSEALLENSQLIEAVAESVKPTPVKKTTNSRNHTKTRRRAV